MADTTMKIARFLGTDAYVVAEVSDDKATFACTCEKWQESTGVPCVHLAAVKAAVKSGDLPEECKWYPDALKLTSPGTRFFAAVGVVLYRIRYRAEYDKWPPKLVTPIPGQSKAKEQGNLPPPAALLAAAEASLSKTLGQPVTVEVVAPPPPVVAEPVKKLTDSELIELAKKTGNFVIEVD